MMDPQSLDIAMTLNFGTPVMVLGRMGTGKYFFSRRAINFIGGEHYQIDMYDLRLDNYYKQKSNGFNDDNYGMKEFDKKILSNPEALLYFTSIEYIKPGWMLRMFELMMFSKHKVIAAGETFDYKPLLDRCKVVRL